MKLKFKNEISRPATFITQKQITLSFITFRIMKDNVKWNDLTHSFIINFNNIPFLYKNPILIQLRIQLF